MYTGNMILFYANNNLRLVSTTLKCKITAVGACQGGLLGGRCKQSPLTLEESAGGQPAEKWLSEEEVRRILPF